MAISLSELTPPTSRTTPLKLALSLTEACNLGCNSKAIQFADTFKPRNDNVARKTLIERSRALAALGRLDDAEKGLRPAKSPSSRAGRLALYNAACYSSLQGKFRAASQDLVKLQEALSCRELSKETAAYEKRLETDPDLAQLRSQNDFVQIKKGFRAETAQTSKKCKTKPSSR